MVFRSLSLRFFLPSIFSQGYPVVGWPRWILPGLAMGLHFVWMRNQGIWTTIFSDNPPSWMPGLGRLFLDSGLTPVGIMLIWNLLWSAIRLVFCLFAGFFLLLGGKVQEAHSNHPGMSVVSGIAPSRSGWSRIPFSNQRGPNERLPETGRAGPAQPNTPGKKKQGNASQPPFFENDLAGEKRVPLQGPRPGVAPAAAIEPAFVPVPSSDEAFLAKVLGILEENAGENRFGVYQLAEAMGLCPRQLQRKMFSLTQHTPGQVIRDFRLKRAAWLLSRQAGNVAEVAQAVGYRKVRYFSKLFHNRFGVAPSRYRKEGSTSITSGGDR